MYGMDLLKGIQSPDLEGKDSKLLSATDSGFGKYVILLSSFAGGGRGNEMAKSIWLALFLSIQMNKYTHGTGQFVVLPRYSNLSSFKELYYLKLTLI